MLLIVAVRFCERQKVTPGPSHRAFVPKVPNWLCHRTLVFRIIKLNLDRSGGEAPMDSERALFIPVILGTVRAGRMSEHAARLVTGELDKRPSIQTELIDIAQMPLPINDAGEATKNPDFAGTMERADALVI